MKITDIPGKLEVTLLPDVRAIHDKWTNYSVSLNEFKTAIISTALPKAKRQGVHAWIVDSADAQGALSQDVQTYIADEAFKQFAANGIKYFITVASKSSVTNMSIRRFSKKTGPHGLTLVETDSVDSAVDWLKKNAA